MNYFKLLWEKKKKTTLIQQQTLTELSVTDVRGSQHAWH